MPYNVATSPVRQEAPIGSADALGSIMSPGDLAIRLSKDLGFVETSKNTLALGNDLDRMQLAQERTTTAQKEITTFTVPKMSVLSVAAQLKDNVLRQQRIAFTAPHDLSFHALQEWEGYVLDIQRETFTARLVDKTAQGTVEGEIGEFAISDISDDDRALLRPGAIFRWTIGYQRTKGGTKRRVSDIVFRRLPMWTKSELSESAKRAKDLAERIVWE